MYENIEIFAGDKAAEIIREKGLKEDDIKTIVGASGGPKFLVLSGLDKSILNTWFKKRTEPLFFIGSSIGSWRGAAYAAKKPVETLDRFTESYLKQHYTSKPSRKEVTDESIRIINDFLKDEDIDFILNKSKINLNIISAQCRGISSLESNIALALSFIPAAIVNLFSRKLLLKIYTRTLFYDSRNTPPFIDSFKTGNRIKLTGKNFEQALLSSGSIPFVMEGIKNIPGAPNGTYRDGGLTDYHINIDFGIKDGIVLFPHFSSRVIPGWLDKSISWRGPVKKYFSNTVLVAPSKKFIESLPMGKIPDRTDFKTFFGRDSERLKYWNEVIKKSSIAGDEFMEAVSSGKIKDMIKSF
ncbi:MAG TPA: patatin-like phospholipase family protein [Spirochaetota bacterium]|nr:patatin-like phospholipase family protein [Spirochaetota bacterium]